MSAQPAFGFPWLTHRTMAEVSRDEARERVAATRRLVEAAQSLGAELLARGSRIEVRNAHRLPSHLRLQIQAQPGRVARYLRGEYSNYW